LWSSAAAHCGSGESGFALEMEAWRKRGSGVSWSDYLADGETEAELTAIRRSTHHPIMVTAISKITPIFMWCISQSDGKYIGVPLWFQLNRAKPLP